MQSQVPEVLSRVMELSPQAPRLIPDVVRGPQGGVDTMSISIQKAPSRTRNGIFGLALLTAVTTTHANLISNGNFELGTFASWTLFTTSNGVIGAPSTPGSPQITSFDTSGTGASSAAQFSVAQVSFNNEQEGGGIFQNFIASSGLLAISVDIAVDRPTNNFNAEGGVFRLLLDGNVVADFATGFIQANQTVRGTLSATGDFGPGQHELRILITRPLTSSSFPLAQYVDNVVVTAVPEPQSSALLLAGIAVIGLLGPRLRRS